MILFSWRIASCTAFPNRVNCRAAQFPSICTSHGVQPRQEVKAIFPGLKKSVLMVTTRTAMAAGRERLPRAEAKAGIMKKIAGRDGVAPKTVVQITITLH